MKQVFADVMVQLQMVRVNEKGVFTAVPNSEHRSVHVCCDALTIKNWPSLDHSIMQQLSQMNDGEHVRPLLQALK